MPDEYYIQDTYKLCGNYAMFWKPHASGYTANLEEAGLYSSKDAKKHCLDHRFVAISKHFINKVKVTVVDIKDLRATKY